MGGVSSRSQITIGVAPKTRCKPLGHRNMPNKIPKYLETDRFLPGSEEEMNHVFVVVIHDD